MFNIGDKVAVLARDPETQKRIPIPQVILSGTKQVRVPAVNRATGEPILDAMGRQRVYVNTVATVMAKNPRTGDLYIRPEEVLNFHIPRFDNVEGLDTLDGKALSMEGLMALYTEKQTERLEAQDAAEVAI